MAAEVSSVARALRRYAEDEKGKRELVTRDLLGGGAVIGKGELDLEIKVVRSGWERQLDLMPTKNYPRIHDLNLPPPPPASTTPPDFNLFSAVAPPTSPSSSPASAAYSSSVCTLDKVRSALERESRSARPAPRSDGSPSPSSSSASGTAAAAEAAAKRRQSLPPRDSRTGSGAEMRAAACPTCLIYVLIAAVDPRCPRCDAHVPVLSDLAQPHKKPRIDLNAAAEDND